MGLALLPQGLRQHLLLEAVSWAACWEHLLRRRLLVLQLQLLHPPLHLLLACLSLEELEVAC